MLHANNYVARCIAWNAARYDRVFDFDLSQRLILEELEEMYKAMEAGDDVGMMDGVGDVAFVCIGVMWKLGLEQDFIERAFFTYDLAGSDAIALHHHACSLEYHSMDLIPDEVQGAFPAMSLVVNSVFVQCLMALKAYGLGHEFHRVVKAICDSNDTKEVKGKTDPTVKANVVKGAGFVPPTAALTEIFLSNNARENKETADA